MGPKVVRSLLGSLLGGAGAVAVLVGAQGTSTAACVSGSWPRPAQASFARAPLGMAVSVSRHGWRLSLRSAAHRTFAGSVTADAGPVEARGSSSLHPSSSGFSFRLPAGSQTETVVFTARCARRLVFHLAGGRVFVGREPAPTPTFTVARPAATGLSGQTIAGPTCPVAGRNCPAAKRIRSTIDISTAPSSRDAPPGALVKTVSTDDQADFSTDLPPGHYVLIAHARTPLPPSAAPVSSMTSTPLDVTVQAGVVSQVTLTFDTGIR